MKSYRLILPILAVAMITYFFLNQPQQQNEPVTYDFDLIIANANLFDGSGNAPVKADIGIKDEMVLAIGDLKQNTGKESIEAEGLSVSPGFIDLHSHADRKVLEIPQVPNMLQQGITTMLGGNCGGSPSNIGEFLAQADKVKLGPNLAVLIGHNTVRKEVMGTENRLASEDEIAAMEALVGQSMKDGAYGLSTGLKYVPGTYSNTEEVVSLAKISAQHNGIYTSHMREEGLGLLEAVKETIEIGQQAVIPVHISHHKAVGLPMWGKSKDSIAMIEAARNAGQDVTLDQYPYTASSTTFAIIFPSWSLAGGNDALVERLSDPDTREKIKQGIIHNIKTDRGGGDPARIQVANYPPQPEYNGKTFKDILVERGVELTIDNTAELAIEIQSKGGGQAIYHAMEESDVRYIMQYEYTSIATDGANAQIGKGSPHPRNYGTYPRVLGKYTRDENVLELSDAIRKMTSLPAARMGLTNRGLIKQGYYADLVIFNPATVIDKATFADPHQHAVGIEYVIVNGKIAKNPQGLTDIGSGKALRHQTSESTGE
ncbi:MAG: D-aminoacylase [Gammaproteobacteria bacterium]|nr:D-aminoacylase [Gammaproteobacteria bacterium]